MPAADFSRFPIQVTTDDLEKANYIIALKQAEHGPLVQERFPSRIEKIEFWDVDDAPEGLTLIEREVMGLTARLIGGGKREELPSQDVGTREVDPEIKRKRARTSPWFGWAGKGRSGRRGKGE